MNLIKCENEHYYDSDKFYSCPHCTNELANVKVTDILGQNQKKIDTVIPDKAVLKDYKKIGHRRVTGWLVCIRGKCRVKALPYMKVSIISDAPRIWMSPYFGKRLFPEKTML